MDNKATLKLIIDNQNRDFDVQVYEVSTCVEHNMTVATCKVIFTDKKLKKSSFLNVDIYHDGEGFTVV